VHRDLIIVDDVPSFRRVAVIRDGVLDQLFCDDAADLMPRPGAVVAVRIEQVFPQHGRVKVKLMGMTASFRTAQAKPMLPGQMIAAKVHADARDEFLGDSRIFSQGKPIQLKPIDGGEFGELPSQSGVLTPAPDALMRGKDILPMAEVIMDEDGTAWEQYGLDDALADALKMTLHLPKGGMIHISTPPGAAVVDGDSGAASLSPQALAEDMVASVMRQLRLRRIAGPIVIDFPRLSSAGRAKISGLMEAAAKHDGLKPSLHGFTRGGLYTMSRPWHLRSLAEELKPPLRMAGLDALRLIRNQGHRQKAARAGVGIRCHPAVLAWLEGDGAEALAELCRGLAFMPKFVSDVSTDGARLDGTAVS
jgi:hypothetical protein